MAFLKNKDMYSHVVLYEDFVQDIEEGSKMLLSAVNVPADQVDLFLQGSKKDSQNNSFRGTLVKRRVTDDQWRICDSLQDQIGSPIRQSMTITQLQNVIQ